MKDRKRDHIEMAFQSQLGSMSADSRFNYEPLLSAHPAEINLDVNFLGKKLKVPVWVSSMTGGTELAGKINANLARACNEFGMGMGLGSCRMLLDSDTYFHQFDVRDIIGPHLPLFANLGIAQIEKLIKNKETEKINQLIYKLKADGLIVHVNPLQEYFQPEGDYISRSPLEILKELTTLVSVKLIVKEVGQGMGPQSLEELMKLPIAGIEFGAFGGTNFTNVELMRGDKIKQEVFAPLGGVGHTADEMLEIINRLSDNFPEKKKQLIISGGIKSFLDGYYLLKKSRLPAVYGQASSFLRYAKEDYKLLKQYTELQIKGLQLANSYLKIREK